MGSMSWQGRRVPLGLWGMIIALGSTESEWPRGVQKNKPAMDATVAFDDLLLERCFWSPCGHCQRAEPGYYVLWMVPRTGFVAMVPLYLSCQRHPDTPGRLAHAIQRRLGIAAEGMLCGRVT